MISKKLAVALVLPILAGCTTDPYTGERKLSNTAGGAGLGALTGAAAGALLSKDKKKGALMGAALGAAAGAGVGLYMDNQDAELRNELQGTGVSVTKLADKSILLNMPGDVTFSSGSDAISADFYRVLDSVAKVLKKYDKTVIRVMGHTDSTGNLAANQTLSESRAQAVASYLTSQGVAGKRFTTEGYGPNKPVADNGTAAGRAQNRRVEIKLVSTE